MLPLKYHGLPTANKYGTISHSYKDSVGAIGIPLGNRYPRKVSIIGGQHGLFLLVWLRMTLGHLQESGERMQKMRAPTLS